MKTIFISRNENDITIIADTTGRITPANNNINNNNNIANYSNEYLEFHTSESIFYSIKQKVCIVHLGQVHVDGLFISAILEDFIVHINETQNELDSEAIKSKLDQYIKDNWKCVSEKIYALSQFVIIKFNESHAEMSKMRDPLHKTVKIEAEKLIEVTEQKIIFKENLSEEAIIEIIRDKKFNRPPFSLYKISLKGEILKMIRGFVYHGFRYLEDYIVSFNEGHFGLDPNTSCPRSELTDRFINKNHALEEIRKQDLFLTYKNFVKIARIDINYNDINYISFFTILFKFINKITKNDEIFRTKLKTILDADVIIFISKSPGGNNDSFAYYHGYANILRLHVNLIDILPIEMCMRIFKHEVEHAFQNTIHKSRWENSSIYDLFQQKIVRERAHTEPYYPYTEDEKNKLFNFINKGKYRLEKLAELLCKEDTDLTSWQKEFINLYKNSVENYIPRKFFENNTYFVDNNYTGEEFYKNKTEKYAGTARRKTTGATCKFDIYGFREKEIPLQNKKVVHNILYYTEKNKSLPFDLLDQYGTYRDDIAELHARTLGEIHPSHLALLFPELLEYANNDYIEFSKTQGLYNDYLIYDPQIIDKTLFNCNKNIFSGIFSSPAISFLKSSNATNKTLEDHKQELINELKKDLICKDKFTAFFESLENNSFSQALRRLSNFNHYETITQLKIFLKYKNIIKIDLDEIQNGKNALYFAINQPTPDIYKLLVENGADESITLPNQSLTIKQLFLKKFPNEAEHQKKPSPYSARFG